MALLLSGCVLEAGGDDLADAELALQPAPPGGFSFAESSDERRKAVPIEGRRKPHVVYSVPLANLDPSERVAVRGEVQLTTCQASDLEPGSPCKRITPFDPKYHVQIVLGKSKDDATGPELSEARDIRCTHFKHHCALALPEHVTHDVSGDRYANLVVWATGSNPSSKDVMIVDDGNGGLYVTRMGAGADASGQHVQGKDVSPSSMKLDMENAHPRKPHVTLRAKLSGVKGGDLLDADALIEAKTRGNAPKPAGCQGARDPLISHQILVSKHAADPFGSKITAMTARNGVNCKLGSHCTYKKSGAARLPKQVPDTVYVSVVSWGGRSCSAPGDEWSLGRASRLRVGRRRAE